MDRKYRILSIHPGPVPPDADKEKNALYHLSRHCEGDLLTTRWRTHHDDDPPGTPCPFDASLGSFQYHATRSTGVPQLFRGLWNFCFFVGKGVALARVRGRYDAIVAYGPHATAAAGLVLSRLTGAKLIIDVPGPPIEPFRYYPGLLPRLKERAGKVLIPALLRRADAIKLLYESQLDGLLGRGDRIVETFHDFVPVSVVTATSRPPAGRYVLFLGYPWFLKGVDVLIRAFGRISDRHPDVELRIVGHCPDRAPFEAIAGGNPRITFHRAVHHAEAMALMAGCSAFVLPSRTEAMGRVLLEAMALRKPIVASRVGGIPTYVEDGRNGLLFESGDVDDLAAKLDALLDDPARADRLAEEGHRRVLSEFSEEAYVARFLEMVQRVVGR